MATAMSRRRPRACAAAPARSGDAWARCPPSAGRRQDEQSARIETLRDPCPGPWPGSRPRVYGPASFSKPRGTGRSAEISTRPRPPPRGPLRRSRGVGGGVVERVQTGLLHAGRLHPEPARDPVAAIEDVPTTEDQRRARGGRAGRGRGAERQDGAQLEARIDRALDHVEIAGALQVVEERPEASESTAARLERFAEVSPARPAIGGRCERGRAPARAR